MHLPLTVQDPICRVSLGFLVYLLCWLAFVTGTLLFTIRSPNRTYLGVLTTRVFSRYQLKQMTCIAMAHAENICQKD